MLRAGPRLETASAAYTRGAMDAALLVKLALGVAVILSGVLVVVARRAASLQRVRAQAIAALCAQRGFLPGAEFGDFETFAYFGSNSVSNSFFSADHRAAVADFIRSPGKDQLYFSILAFTVAGLNVPYLAVTRRHQGAPTIGGPPNVELESIEFDQRFAVRTNDRRSAVMLLDPGVMQLLLDCEPVGFYMAGDKALAFVNRTAELLHPTAEPIAFEVLFRFWDGFVARVPALVRTEYAAPP